jgi:hypothetical protein
MTLFDFFSLFHHELLILFFVLMVLIACRILTLRDDFKIKIDGLADYFRTYRDLLGISDNDIDYADTDNDRVFGDYLNKLRFFVNNPQINRASILVDGGPGYGKTVLINTFLKKSSKSDVEIIRFNAWHFNSLQEVVLNVLLSLAKKFNYRYFDSLIKPLTSIKLNYLGVGLDANIDNNLDFYTKLLEFKNFVGKSLKNKNKKLIFVFDDIERMNIKEEILGVLKSINMFLDIPNVYVLVAANTESIKKILEKDNYEIFERVFDYSINLNPISPTRVVDVIRHWLSDNNEIGSFIDLELFLNQLETVLFKSSISFTSYREVKRVFDSFISYRDLFSDISLIDIFLMEILRKKHIEVWKDLVKKRIVFSNSHLFEGLKYFIYSGDIFENREKSIVDILTRLRELYYKNDLDWIEVGNIIYYLLDDKIQGNRDVKEILSITTASSVHLGFPASGNIYNFSEEEDFGKKNYIDEYRLRVECSKRLFIRQNIGLYAFYFDEDKNMLNDDPYPYFKDLIIDTYNNCLDKRIYNNYIVPFMEDNQRSWELDNFTKIRLISIASRDSYYRSKILNSLDSLLSFDIRPYVKESILKLKRTVTDNLFEETSSLPDKGMTHVLWNDLFFDI